MSKKSLFAAFLIVLLAFLIPIEHKYDKLFRFYSLTLIPNGLEISSTYDPKLYFYISDLIGLILLAIALSSIPLKRFFFNPLWIVWISALLSITFSPFACYPVAYTRLLQLLTPIVLFSFISHGFSEEERPKLTQAVLMAVVIASLFQTAVAVAQYFHQAPLGLRLLGETNEKTIFTIQDGSRWLIDQFLQRKAGPVVMRAAGTFTHANVFGGFMFFSIIATYALSIRFPKIAFVLPFQIFALAISYSRAALFAWALATLCWFVQMRFPKQLFSIIAFSFLLSASLLGNQYFHRGGIVNSTSLSKDSNEIRIFHQKTALSIIKEVPFFGLGFSQFSERAQKFFPEDARAYVKSTAPHNIFLFLACETGLISLFAFLAFLFLLFWNLFQNSISVESATFSSLLIGFLFIGFCDFYPILFQQGKLMFFLSAALLPQKFARDSQMC